MPRRKPRPSADELRRMYHEERLTVVEMAERLAVGKNTVTRWMRAAGVERRHPGSTAKAKPAALAPAPFPTPGKRGTRKQVRPWHRLTSVEQKFVAQQVDNFLIWAGKKREEEEAHV